MGFFIQSLKCQSIKILKMKNTSLYFLVIIAIFSSCNSTKITNSWSAPDKHLHTGEWNKILVVAFLKNDTHRRKVEDELLNYLNGKGIVSYEYLKGYFNKIGDVKFLKKIKADGFDGAITMRLIDIDKEKIFIPEQQNLYPTYYQNFSGYYHRGWAFYTSPGYYLLNKTFIVETVVYSIKEDKIIWSGITESFNPDGVVNMTSDISKLIYKKMLAEGFVVKK
jgi:hypothetical protein